jgi:hypothetical protein
LFIYRAYSRYREDIKSNLSKCWIKDLTDFKPLGKRVRNNIIYLIAIISTDLNKLKACVIVVIKLTSELNMLLTTPRGSKALVYN